MNEQMSRDSHDFAGLQVEALVSRAQSGSLDAFTEVVARFEGRLFNFIARRLGGGRRPIVADAEDLTQEAFLRAWRNLGDFRPTHKFSTWLFTIAGRLVVDHLRHQGVRKAAAESIAHDANRRMHDQQRERSPLVDVESRNLWTIARETLTDEQHAALWLRYAEDLSPGEVARVLGRSEVSVRVMLFRARKALAPHAMSMLRGQEHKKEMRSSPVAGGVT